MIIKFLLIAAIVASTVTNSFAKCIASNAIRYPRRYVSRMTDKFFGDFYPALAKHEQGNLIFSPISLNMILTTASFGASGNTERQLKTSLRLPCNKNIAAEGYRQLIQQLRRVKGVKLKLVNKIFISHTSQLQDNFRNRMKKFFRSDISVMKSTKSEQTAKDINNWFASETDHHITNLLTPSDVENAEILLANAVYFKGEWTNKFDPQWTKPYPFSVNKKTKKNVPMMFTEAEFYWGYLLDLKSSFIELPYGNQTDPTIKMIVILPNLGVNIRDVERKIKKLHSILFDGSTSKVALHLPKFKIESKFELKPILQEVGITEMFEDTADFSGMIKNSKLKVNKVVQKVVLEVNEEGSEAAAASAMEIQSREGSAEFTVDRPFLCVIVRHRIKSILFAARVMDPTAG